MAKSMMIAENTQTEIKDKAKFLFPFALFLLALISRLPFRTEILYHWDSVNFAYSLKVFDIARDQPQPPGYILYVILCRGIDYFINNPQNTMVWLSIFSSSLAVVALYYLGREMFNWKTGLISALFLLFSPLFWFYGEVALPHTLDAFLVILSVWLLYRINTGASKNAILPIIILAISGGFRPQTLVFLLPLTIYALRRVGWMRFIGLGILGAVICLLWFVPLVNSVNGVSNYFAVMGAYSDRFQSTTSLLRGAGLFGLRRNLTKLTLYTIFALSASFGGLVFLPAIFKKDCAPKKDTVLFLLFWIVPSVLYYLLIHMGQQGLVFTFLPALFLILAFLTENGLNQKKNLLIVAVLIICVLNASIFLFVPEYPLANSSQRLLTRETLKNSDQYYSLRLEAIRRGFDPKNTLIFASNWHHVEYYLSEFRTSHFNIGYKWDADEGEIDSGDKFVVAATGNDGNRATNVILFDPELNQINLSKERLAQISLSEKEFLDYFELFPGDVLEVGEGYIKVLD